MTPRAPQPTVRRMRRASCLLLASLATAAGCGTVARPDPVRMPDLELCTYREGDELVVCFGSVEPLPRALLDPSLIEPPTGGVPVIDVGTPYEPHVFLIGPGGGRQLVGRCTSQSVFGNLGMWMSGQEWRFVLRKDEPAEPENIVVQLVAVKHFTR